MTAAKMRVRLRNKEYGTVVRIIRTTAIGGELHWVCRDETYGGVCWLPIEQYTAGAWEVLS